MTTVNRARYDGRVTVRQAACVALAVLAGGCSVVVGKSIDPFQTVDFTGEYTLTVTNDVNGCGFDEWREGESNDGFPLSIAQDGDELRGTLEGTWAIAADILLGNHSATGTANGNSMEMRLQGSRHLQIRGGCQDFVVDAIMEGTLDRDYLEGVTAYRVVETDESSSCEGMTGCETLQLFNGTRPPQ